MFVEVYCDGAVRDDGKDAYGAAACAYIIYKNNRVAFRGYRLLGKVSSNEAEYEAVLNGVLVCLAADYFNPIIYTDSNTVYEQFNRIQPCKSPRLVPLLYTLKKIQHNFNFTVTHVSRSHVAEADALCNEILNEFQGYVPSEDIDI